MTGTDRTRPPAADEIEVSLFGPGVGESVVVHLGGGEWMVVDSCRRPSDGKPAALEYLRDIGVDLATQVRMILITHWHDDHIRGAGEIFRSCTSAELACSAALRTEELLTLHFAQSRMPFESGIVEFSELLDELKTRRGRGVRRESAGPKWAIADRSLLQDNGSGLRPAYDVWALSPSDASLTLAFQEIAACLPPPMAATKRIGPPKRRAVARRPNHAAVVLRVRVGQVEVLLGSDLELSTDPSTGWNAVLACRPPVGRAGAFKVPHHGSANGHEPRLWNQQLAKDTHAILTPFLSGKKPLPTEDDVKRLLGNTSNLFITSRARWAKPAKRDAAVERTMAGIGQDRKAMKEEFGQVRLRGTVSTTGSVVAELFGTAHRLPAR